MIIGQITLNGVNDKELVAIIQAKDASATTLSTKQITPSGPTFAVTLEWNNEAGFRNLSTLLQTLVGLGG